MKPARPTRTFNSSLIAISLRDNPLGKRLDLATKGAHRLARYQMFGFSWSIHVRLLLVNPRRGPGRHIQPEGCKLRDAVPLHLDEQPKIARYRGKQPEVKIRSATVVACRRLRGFRMNVQNRGVVLVKSN